jgi:uncharacterized repeat protein (TIGR01451 family)
MTAFLRFAALCALAVGVTAGAAAAATPGGVVISNAVTLTYSDGAASYSARSNTVQITTVEISALIVSPKNATVSPLSDDYATGQPVVRTFTLTNSSNISDAYTIVSAASSAGSITAIAFVANGTSTPASVNGAPSPLVQPGASIAVSVTIATAGVPAGTVFNVTLTARTTVTGTSNGLVSDSGEQWAQALVAPQFAGLAGGNTSITKTVDAVRSEAVAPGSGISYQISFKNYGAMAATNAVLTDVVPPGITADPAGVTINGTAAAAQLSGQTLTVPLGTVAAQAALTVAFNARVAATQTIGATYVNTASVAADGVSAVSTTPASIVAGNADIVYNGYTAGQTPIAGALVALVDSVTKIPVVLPATAVQSTGRSVQSVNSANANPFTTGGNGAYAFAIPPPAPGTTASYDLVISAPGYLARDIGVLLTPDPTDLLYSVMLTSKDGQPLAQAGSFTLTSSNVMLADVFGLLGNLPLFTSKPITVTKTADKPAGAPGDSIGFSVTIAPAAGTNLGPAAVTDTLPAGLAYAPGTARVDGVAVEPARAGNQLTWNLPVLGANVTHTIVYACVILPGVTAGTTLTNAVNVSAPIPGTTLSANGAASFSIVATSGAFGERGTITGRVRAGEKPLAGVRVFLEDGESVTTDAGGRFSFHSVRPGMHVLRLDETTLPPGVHAYPDRRYDSVRSPIRLIHGVLDEGLLQDVPFEVAPAP